MNNWPALSKAPIVEGLIDIRVEPSILSTFDAIKAACDDLAGEFPSRSDMHQFVAQFQYNPAQGLADTSLATGGAQGGVLLRSIDEKWVVQFRVDGFTISRLQPYGSWDELKGKAAQLWTVYTDAAKPSKVTQIATRFINRVQIPFGESFEKIFLTNFVIGPNLPQSVAGFLLRMAIPFEEQNAIGIVTQSLEGNNEDCILDLDVVSQRPDGIDNAEIWRILEQLREVKNRLFFGSVTEAALERFK
jgi:uncharacterized protein (TIGR04255 family)